MCQEQETTISNSHSYKDISSFSFPHLLHIWCVWCVCECVHVHLVGVSTCVCMHIWCVCTRVHACTSDGWVCGCTGVHMCRCVRRWVGASMCVGGWQWIKPSKFNSGGTNNSPTIILPPSPSKLKICSPWNNFTSPSTHSWKDEISLEPKSPVSHNPKPPNYSAYIFYMLQGTKTKKKNLRRWV